MGLKFQKGDVVRPLSKVSRSKYFNIKKLKKAEIIRIENNPNDANNNFIVIKVIEGEARRSSRYSGYGYLRPYKERDSVHATKGKIITLLSNSFILFDDIEEAINFKIGDIVIPNGNIKTSKGFTLKTIKKAEIVEVLNYHSSRKEIRIKILEGDSIRQYSMTYPYSYVSRNNIIRVFQDSFKLKINPKDKLTYSMF